MGEPGRFGRRSPYILGDIKKVTVLSKEYSWVQVDSAFNKSSRGSSIRNVASENMLYLG